MRPISLSPFPFKAVQDIADQVDHILVVEMNAGMMLEDVLKVTQGRAKVEFYGRMGGVMPFPDEILWRDQEDRNKTGYFRRSPARSLVGTY